jgi:hypothetical protein
MALGGPGQIGIDTAKTWRFRISPVASNGVDFSGG